MWSRHWFLLLCCMTLLPQLTQTHKTKNIKSDAAQTLAT